MFLNFICYIQETWSQHNLPNEKSHVTPIVSGNRNNFDAACASNIQEKLHATSHAHRDLSGTFNRVILSKIAWYGRNFTLYSIRFCRIGLPDQGSANVSMHLQTTFMWNQASQEIFRQNIHFLFPTSWTRNGLVDIVEISETGILVWDDEKPTRKKSESIKEK